MPPVEVVPIGRRCGPIFLEIRAHFGQIIILAKDSPERREWRTIEPASQSVCHERAVWPDDWLRPKPVDLK